jgi:threonine synthase
LTASTVKYFSTNLTSPKVSFSEALLKGIAPDGGLYLPDSIPVISTSELSAISGKEYYETAFFVLSKFIGNEIGSDKLLSICRDAYDFEVPLEKADENRYILRLDRGPTASFKDFAARIMSRIMQHYLSVSNRHITILTATSGDTGSAVASAFYGLKNIDVIILYPEKEVTTPQRKQMTTLSGNIKVIAINGKFDDCQRLVKSAFSDPQLSHIDLSSANSINIGRLMPQTVYYFHAFSRLREATKKNVVFSIPSGNLGNLMGGILAFKAGLPVDRFIVATNENDEVPEFIKSGVYRPIEPSKNCISSAMNVGHPSNLPRLVALYGGVMNEKGNILINPDFESLGRDIFAVSVNDKETRKAISELYENKGIPVEPHGAVAMLGIDKYLQQTDSKITEKQVFISLETAHPAKFPDIIREITGKIAPLPFLLKGLAEKDESFYKMENDYKELKKFIKNSY